MDKEDKENTLKYLWNKFKECEKLGLKEEANEFKNKYYSLKDFDNMNYHYF